MNYSRIALLFGNLINRTNNIIFQRFRGPSTRSHSSRGRISLATGRREERRRTGRLLQSSESIIRLEFLWPSMVDGSSVIVKRLRKMLLNRMIHDVWWGARETHFIFHVGLEREFNTGIHFYSIVDYAFLMQLFAGPRLRTRRPLRYPQRCRIAFTQIGIRLTDLLHSLSPFPPESTQLVQSMGKLKLSYYHITFSFV